MALRLICRQLNVKQTENTKTPYNHFLIFPLDGVNFATIVRSKIEKDYAKCNCSHQAKLDFPAVKVNNLGKKNSSKNILYLD